MTDPTWQPLGRPAPLDLVDARLQLHHAALVVAAVGQGLLAPRPDDSHPNLGWLAGAGVLAGRAVAGERPFRAALSPADLSLRLLDEDDRERDRLALDGRTREEALSWLRAAIDRHAGAGRGAGVVLPDYELPHHPVARGGRFGLEAAGAEALAELGRWLANAHVALEGVAASHPEAGEVRCWPHHFDLATLLALETGDEGAVTRSVGVGLSPGDEGHPEPYWYVTPWPYPPADTPLPVLPEGGFWHREGYTAALLRGSYLVADDPGSGEEQRRRLQDFLDSAITAARALAAS